MNDAQRKVTSHEFFARNPVFSLPEASQGLAPGKPTSTVTERLRHHLATGRLKLVARGLYAVVPPGTSPDAHRTDPFLVAAAARPDAVFSHHSALELLGAAHSVWRDTTVYSTRRRRPVALEDGGIRFLIPPPQMIQGERPFACRRFERRGRLLWATGPERTLVEGLKRPQLVGGLEELILSAGGFPTLDLGLLEEVLQRYETANLWAATGWFLQRHQRTFHVPEAVLERWARHVPSTPQYLARGRRGGTLDRRWNIVVPDEVAGIGGPDEP